MLAEKENIAGCSVLDLAIVKLVGSIVDSWSWSCSTQINVRRTPSLFSCQPSGDTNDNYDDDQIDDDIDDNDDSDDTDDDD